MFKREELPYGTQWREVESYREKQVASKEYQWLNFREQKWVAVHPGNLPLRKHSCCMHCLRYRSEDRTYLHTLPSLVSAWLHSKDGSLTLLLSNATEMCSCLGVHFWDAQWHPGKFNPAGPRKYRLSFGPRRRCGPKLVRVTGNFICCPSGRPERQ